MNELSKNQLHYLNMHRRHKRIIAVSRVSILLTFLFLWEFSANIVDFDGVRALAALEAGRILSWLG